MSAAAYLTYFFWTNDHCLCTCNTVPTNLSYCRKSSIIQGNTVCSATLSGKHRRACLAKRVCRQCHTWRNSWILDLSLYIYVTVLFYSRSDHSLNVIYLAVSDLIGHLQGNNIIVEQASLQARCDCKCWDCSLFLFAFTLWTIKNKVYSVAVYLGSGLVALITNVLGKKQPGEWLERHPGSR